MANLKSEQLVRKQLGVRHSRSTCSGLGFVLVLSLTLRIAGIEALAIVFACHDKTFCSCQGSTGSAINVDDEV